MEDLTAKNEKRKVPGAPFGPPHHHPDMPQDSRRLAEVNPYIGERIVPLRRSYLRVVLISVEGQTLESQRYWRGQKPKTKCIPSLPPFDIPARDKEQGTRCRPRPHHARPPSRTLLLATHTSFREASMRRKMKRRMVKPQSDEPP